MKKGEKAKLTCKSDYAYGKAGSPPSIPGNATLLFEVEVLGWKGQDCSPNGDFGVEKFIVTKSDKKKTPNDGALVKCHIAGDYEGRTFDERDVEFNIGEGENLGIIPGVEYGIEKMNQGETARFVIQPKYAFGKEGHKDFNIPSNAVVEYRVTLNEFEKGVESWKLDPTESLEQAKLFKEKGTNYFKQDKFKLALKFYEKCHSFLSNCETNEDGEAKTLNISVYLNIALCHQKMNNFDEMKNAVSSKTM
jgi:FK506-binding protein 4/5